jgi:hypothetical protein
MKKNAVNRACGPYRGDERCMRGFNGKTSEKDHLQDPRVDERII